MDKDQTCGVPGRFIREKVAYLRDVVDYSSPAGVPWAIISLSQEKPFDCVDWGFMRDTLFTMDFGPSFISCIDLFIGARRVLSMSMVTFLPIFLCHVGFVKAVFCRPFSTLW